MDDKKYAENLAAICEAEGIPAYAVDAVGGLPRNQTQKYMDGLYPPEGEKLVILTRVLGVSSGMILGTEPVQLPDVPPFGRRLADALHKTQGDLGVTTAKMTQIYSLEWADLLKGMTAADELPNVHQLNRLLSVVKPRALWLPVPGAEESPAAEEKKTAKKAGGKRTKKEPKSEQNIFVLERNGEPVEAPKGTQDDVVACQVSMMQEMGAPVVNSSNVGAFRRTVKAVLRHQQLPFYLFVRLCELPEEWKEEANIREESITSEVLDRVSALLQTPIPVLVGEEQLNLTEETARIHSQTFCKNLLLACGLFGITPYELSKRIGINFTHFKSQIEVNQRIPNEERLDKILSKTPFQLSDLMDPAFEERCQKKEEDHTMDELLESGNTLPDIEMLPAAQVVENVKQLCAEADLSLVNFAAICGVEDYTLRKNVLRYKNLPRPVIQRFADVFGLPFDALIGTERPYLPTDRDPFYIVFRTIVDEEIRMRNMTRGGFADKIGMSTKQLRTYLDMSDSLKKNSVVLDDILAELKLTFPRALDRARYEEIKAQKESKTKAKLDTAASETPQDSLSGSEGQTQGEDKKLAESAPEALGKQLQGESARENVKPVGWAPPKEKGEEEQEKPIDLESVQTGVCLDRLMATRDIKDTMVLSARCRSPRLSPSVLNAVLNNERALKLDEVEIICSAFAMSVRQFCDLEALPATVNGGRLLPGSGALLSYSIQRGLREKNMTPEELAHRLRINEMYVYAWLCNIKKEAPSLKQIQEMAAVFDVPVNQLMDPPRPQVSKGEARAQIFDILDTLGPVELDKLYHQLRLGSFVRPSKRK